MRKFLKRMLLIFLAVTICLIAGCVFSDIRMYESTRKTYEDESTYVTITGVVSQIYFHDDSIDLRIDFDDPEAEGLVPERAFEIVGKNFNIVMDHEARSLLVQGAEIEVVAGFRAHIYDYVQPIVALKVDGVTILEYEEGLENFLSWIRWQFSY